MATTTGYKELKSRAFIYVDGSSDKFYILSLYERATDGKYLIYARYGRRRNSKIPESGGQIRHKFGSNDLHLAKRQFSEFERERRKKGYMSVVLPAGVSPATVPVSSGEDTKSDSKAPPTPITSSSPASRPTPTPLYRPRHRRLGYSERETIEGYSPFVQTIVPIGLQWVDVGTTKDGCEFTNRLGVKTPIGIYKELALLMADNEANCSGYIEKVTRTNGGEKKSYHIFHLTDATSIQGEDLSAESLDNRLLTFQMIWSFDSEKFPVLSVNAKTVGEPDKVKRSDMCILQSRDDSAYFEVYHESPEVLATHIPPGSSHVNLMVNNGTTWAIKYRADKKLFPRILSDKYILAYNLRSKIDPEESVLLGAGATIIKKAKWDYMMDGVQDDTYNYAKVV